MKIRNLHRYVGLILLIPFLAWIFTAMVFYIKPGYAGAYDLLQPKTYPLTDRLPDAGTDSTWMEFKYVKTILGFHVLVRTKQGRMQLDPQTLRPREIPTDEKIRLLVNDALSDNPDRYGEVAAIAHDTITTTTNIRIILDWNSLRLDQRGDDTDRIDMLYKIHYLQWTGISALDKILGPLGLSLVLLLSILGFRLAVKTKQT